MVPTSLVKLGPEVIVRDFLQRDIVILYLAGLAVVNVVILYT